MDTPSDEIPKEKVTPATLPLQFRRTTISSSSLTHKPSMGVKQLHVYTFFTKLLLAGHRCSYCSSANSTYSPNSITSSNDPSSKSYPTNCIISHANQTKRRIGTTNFSRTICTKCNTFKKKVKIIKNSGKIFFSSIRSFSLKRIFKKEKEPEVVETPVSSAPEVRRVHSLPPPPSMSDYGKSPRNTPE
jgi:hypothetical protein